jgi:hypothetical protein
MSFKYSLLVKVGSELERSTRADALEDLVFATPFSEGQHVYVRHKGSVLDLGEVVSIQNVAATRDLPPVSLLHVQRQKCDDEYVSFVDSYSFFN